MKRKFMLCLLALTVTVSAAGCKKKAVETEPPTETETETQTETQTQKPTETEKEDSMNKTRKLKGLVKSSDANSLTIQTERGKELKFTTTGADIQLTNGITAGSTVTIMYKGEVVDTDTTNAKVLMVVDLEASETPVTEGEEMTEAETSDPDAGSGTLTGSVYDINTDRIVVLSDDGELYYFTISTAKMNLTNGLQEGNYVTVAYTGDIYGPELVTADSITDDNEGTSAAAVTTSGVSYISGTLEECSTSTTTIITDEGETLSFDTSDAAVDYANGFAYGSYITMTYTGTLSGSDTTGVKVVEVSDYTDGTADTAADTATDTTADAATSDAGTTTDANTAAEAADGEATAEVIADDGSAA